MIVHIVPTLPPEFNGLADYCFKLSQNWLHEQVSWGCLTLRVPDGAQESWPAATIQVFEPTEQGLSSALEALPADTVILHYVNYAYDARGVPDWLSAALLEWKKRHPRGRLVTMFHELWATQPPWRRSFWILPAAKSIAAQLADLSDRWITSSELYFDRIIALGAESAKGAVIPVATNIEPAAPIDFHRSWPLPGGKLKIVVFGLAATRNIAISMHLPLLRKLCAQDMIEQISVVGQKPRDTKQIAALDHWVSRVGYAELWHQFYDLSPLNASLLLKENHIGLVKETPAFLSKSGVFAALCSHGVLPICTALHRPSETPHSPFLEDDNQGHCVASLKDSVAMAQKQGNLQCIATTSLTWKSVAAMWMNHVGLL